MKSFVCSLCHNGIVGGGLYLDSQSLTYKTNKLTVGKKYRNLVLPMQEIKEISWKWIVFPIATVNMKMENPITASRIQSTTRHVEPCGNKRGPPRKAKYSLVTDSA